MTKLEDAAKRQITRILGQQGYGTYAKLFGLFDLELTDDPNTVGYMIPDEAKIVLNSGLDTDQVSTLVRHEILHEYLTHGPRQEKFHKTNTTYTPDRNLSNIAADFEISNRGYTDADKDIARSIKLNGQYLRGLVTEDKFPQWTNKTYEEMYKELLDTRDKLKQLLQDIQNNGMTPPSKQTSGKASEMIQQASQVADKSKAEANMDKKGSGESKEQKDSDRGKKSAGQGENEAEKIADEAEDIKNEADKLSKEKEENGDVFSDPEQAKKEEELAKRMKEIQQAFDEVRNSNSLFKEVETNIEKEKAAKAARDLERYKSSDIVRFKDSLDRFIRSQIAVGRSSTWKKFNPTYVGSGVLRKGTSRESNAPVPVVNVYFDRSGSFSGRPEKTKSAEAAISSLNQYVREGRLKVNLYYASTDVFSNRQEAEERGGGMYSDPVIRHIQATKPDNVIILSDCDSDFGTLTASVPGVVWYLFYENDSPNFIKRLRGKTATRAYLMYQ